MAISYLRTLALHATTLVTHATLSGSTFPQASSTFVFLPGTLPSHSSCSSATNPSHNVSCPWLSSHHPSEASALSSELFFEARVARGRGVRTRIPLATTQTHAYTATIGYPGSP